MTRVQFRSLDRWVLAPGKLLPCLKEAVANLLPKHLPFGLLSTPVQLVTKSFTEAVADPAWIQSTIAAI